MDKSFKNRGLELRGFVLSSSHGSKFRLACFYLDDDDDDEEEETQAKEEEPEPTAAAI